MSSRVNRAGVRTEKRPRNTGQAAGVFVSFEWRTGWEFGTFDDVIDDRLSGERRRAFRFEHLA